MSSVSMMIVGAASLGIFVLHVRRNQRLTWGVTVGSCGNATIYVLGLSIVNLSTFDLTIACASRSRLRLADQLDTRQLTTSVMKVLSSWFVLK
ncbi:hypothetical protein NA56DRAFT_695920 [Hyaloscypha hepaticicola]|uniref:Uncharacterized protein n=1 Tax=Hyaloscypha hepaticicola TaxID=2082293 RepID=A0A2J6QPH7_9HELO|nr:hypothetical protein NA56DRAFT_695920 [Hyaloscypha hepaticicola]